MQQICVQNIKKKTWESGVALGVRLDLWFVFKEIILFSIFTISTFFFFENIFWNIILCF